MGEEGRQRPRRLPRCGNRPRGPVLPAGRGSAPAARASAPLRRPARPTSGPMRKSGPSSSAARTAVAAFSAWCAAGQRRGEVVDALRRRQAQSRPRERRLTRPRSRVSSIIRWSVAPAWRAASSNTASASGRRLETSAGRPAPEDAGLLEGDLRDRRPEIFHVVERDRRHHREDRRRHVGRVEPAAEARPRGRPARARGAQTRRTPRPSSPRSRSPAPRAPGPPPRTPRRAPHRAPPGRCRPRRAGSARSRDSRWGDV